MNKQQKKDKGWEERFRQLYEGANCEGGCISSRMCGFFIGFISTELQEAERRGYRKALKDAEKLIDECDQRYDGFSWIMWDEGVNKLLKK